MSQLNTVIFSSRDINTLKNWYFQYDSRTDFHSPICWIWTILICVCSYMPRNNLPVLVIESDLLLKYLADFDDVRFKISCHNLTRLLEFFGFYSDTTQDFVLQVNLFPSGISHVLQLITKAVIWDPCYHIGSKSWGHLKCVPQRFTDFNFLFSNSFPLNLCYNG